MAACPMCRSACDDGARFCPHCAAPLGQGHPAPQPVGHHGYQQPPQHGYQQPAQAPQAPKAVQPVAPAPYVGAPMLNQPTGPAQPSAEPTGQPPYRAPVPAGFGMQQQGQHAGPMPPAPVLPKRPMRPGRSPLRFIPMALGPLITVAVVAFMFIGGGSCSSVEGTFQSAGEPVGTFTFTPAQCRSGERMNVHGAVLLGEGPNDGAVVVIDDPVQGPIVKVEVPGSCQPPDLEVCTEVTIDKSQCRVFKHKIRRTSTQVNDIRLMAGSLELDCQFKEGGNVKAKFDFDNCD